MWIKSKILNVGDNMAKTTTENQFIMFCVINGDNVECKATNMDETFAEILKVPEVMTRVKELNKRIRYDETTVVDALTQQQPDDVLWLDEQDDSIKGLKLKYTIRNCPFNFSFHLKKGTGEEHKTSLMVPVFRTISSLNKQIQELKDAVQRKDIEIQQHKREGAILKRTTVSTLTFDFDDFHKRYEECNQLAEMLEPIGAHFMEQLKNKSEIVPVSHTNIVNVEENCVSPKKNDTHKKELNKSPKNRKRTAMARKQVLINRQLLSRKQNMDYESSQSCSQNSVDLEIDKKELKVNAEMRENEQLTPRRKRKAADKKSMESDSEGIQDEILNCRTPTRKTNVKKTEKGENNSLYLSEDETSSDPKSPVRKRVAPQVSNSNSAGETTDEDKQKNMKIILQNLEDLNKRRYEDMNKKKQEKK